MYNEEQKWAFIAASYPNEAKQDKVAGLFALFTPYEEAWGIDLVRQHIDRLQPAFDEIAKSISATKVRALLSALKKYRLWYLATHPNAVSAGVALLKLNIEDKLRDCMVASPAHLKLVMDQVLDPPEMGTPDCIYRVYLWLAFAGVPRDRATLVTVDEVDFYLMQIHHDGRDYRIYPEGLAEIHRLCESDSLVSIHRNPDYERPRPRIEGNQLLRGVSLSQSQVDAICKNLSKRLDKTKWALTYENMQACGLYFEKYEQERAGLAVSFVEETRQRLADLALANGTVTEDNRYKIRGRYEKGYNQWKALYKVE